MNNEGSITRLLVQAQGGDPRAAIELWNTYLARLLAVARTKLAGAAKTAADEEDAALSAFGSLLKGMKAGRFQRLNDREDLWQVLVMLTVRKAINQRKREAAIKRGGGKVRGESAFGMGDDDELAAGIAQVVGEEPTPEFIVEMEEECERLLRLLDDEQRQMALWRLEGYSNQEIAQMSGHVISWVERKFRIIRRRWGHQPQMNEDEHG